MSDPSDALRLLGSWLMQGRNADEPESRVARFASDGSLLYTIFVDEREIVMRLRYRVEGDELVTRDEESGGEIRSHFRFAGNDELIMTFGDEAFAYVRLEEREPSS